MIFFFFFENNPILSSELSRKRVQRYLIKTLIDYNESHYEHILVSE